MRRLLLAVEDSPDSLAAAHLAIELARDLGAQLRIVHVLVDHELDAALTAATGVHREERGRFVDGTILGRVVALAEAQGVAPETALLEGDVGQAVLDDARAWAADLVVIGRSRRGASGEPYVGAQTRHVLEFAGRPVLVVPRSRRPGSGPGPRSPR